MAPVIIFGPTGNIGSVVARTCLDHKAETVLAMRDPKKPIPGLTKEDELTAQCIRVQADLGDQSSVSRAITSTGATRAFVYLLHGSTDHMRTTLQTMKAAGINFVVFLSSFTIPSNAALSDVKPADYIPYVHAQVELGLDEVFGQDHYVAIRPGGFVTNMLPWKDGIAKGKVRLFAGHFETDRVTPGDIGRVSGSVLLSGPRNGQKKVYVYGPQIISNHDVLLGVAKILDHPIEIENKSAVEELNESMQNGWPRHVAESVMNTRNAYSTHTPLEDRFPHYNEGVNNVKLYTGTDAERFTQWVKDNKHLFMV